MNQHTHENQRIYLAIALAGLCELPLLTLLFKNTNYQSHLSLVTALAGHILAGFFLFFIPPRGQGFFHHQRRWTRLFFSFGFFLPAVGWLLCFFFYVIFRQPEHPEVIFAEDPVFFADQQSVLELSPPDISPAAKRKRLIEALDLMPLADVLATDDSDLKRGAIDKLAQLATPEAIAVLQDNRSAPQPEVRFYVISALTRIKKDLDEELAGARNELKKNPEDTVLRLYAARTYLKIIRSGLADDATRQTLTGEALYQLNRAAASPEAPHEALELLADLHMDLHDWTATATTLDKLEQRPDANRLSIAKRRINAAYQSGNATAVIAGLRSIMALSDQNLGEQTALWRAAAYLWGSST